MPASRNHPVSMSVRVLVGCLLALLSFASMQGADVPAGAARPLKVLLLTGGGYHDYQKLIPHLTTALKGRVNATFEVRWDLESLHDPKFADGFDAVFYDVCFDEAPDDVLDHALATSKAGKPTVLVHCAVHAFRKSPKIREWETCCGMRSKVHDRYEPFDVKKLDDASPITRVFPAQFHTDGDELYQTIAIDPDSHRLLEAKSPVDGRVHTVGWTYQFGKGRVFATTLGHDMKTAGTPEYLQLLANGLLWSCDKLQADGTPARGYAAGSVK